MSKGFCPDDADLFVGINRPHGNGAMFENGRSNANPIFAGREEASQQAREIRDQNALIDAVNESISPDSLPSQPLNGGDRQQISSGAKQLAELYDKAIAAEDIRTNEFERAVNVISGSTVADASKWLDLTNTVSRLFAWKDAAFNKFALTNFGTEGRSILDNPLVAAFHSVEPTTQGQYQKFLQTSESLARKWDYLANRTGYDTKDLLEAAGFYANAQHVPEVNALLLNRWAAEAAAERAKPVDRQNQRYITDRESWIAELRSNLDTVREMGPDGSYYIDSEGRESRLKSAGHTNAEATKIMNDVLERTGASPAEMDAMAQDIRDFYQQVMQTRIENGLVSSDLVATFPEFQSFVPLKTKYDNTTGAVNNTSIYNPSNYYAIEGSTRIPDSSWHSVLHFARRVSNEIGMQRFGTELAAAKMVAERQGRNIPGMEMRDYGQLMRLKNSSDQITREWATNIDSRGGVIVDVPSFDAEGNAGGLKRMVISFDPNWTDARSGTTGGQLNDAINGKTKVAAGTSLLATPTSWYGQMFTRFNPAFAPVNSIRDLFERALNMAGRDYYDEAGNVVRGSSLGARYFLNAPRTGKFLYDALNGKLDPQSPGAQYWREYVENGVHQQYTRGQNEQRRSLADFINEQTAPPSWLEQNLSSMPGVKQRLDALGAGGREVMRVLDGWNDYFNNTAIFNQFVTLREAGLSARNAAQGTIEMLNLYQGGKLQPVLSMFFPFVKPTIQSGVAMARSLGLAPNAKGQFQPNLQGTMAILGATAAYTALMPLMKEALGRDPETNLYRFDQLSLSDLQRFMPIGFGDNGEYFKMPTGFGPTQLATTLAVGADRVNRGIMRPEDFLFETLFVVGKNVTPGDWPEFSLRAKPVEWMQQAFTPSVLKPVFSGVDFRGRPITNAQTDGFRARADQGRLSTEKVYHQAAKELHSTTGIDLAPEQVKNWARHLNVGPVRLLTALLSEFTGQDTELKTRGQQTTAKEEMGPWLSALGGSLFYGKTYDNGRSMYYRALDEFKERVRREGIDVQSRAYGNDPVKREAFQTAALKRAGWSSDDINDFLTLARTETELRSGNQKFNQSIRPVWLSSDESGPIRREFEKLAIDQGNIYNAAVNQLKYYAGAR